jgi:hypothetical protein
LVDGLGLGGSVLGLVAPFVVGGAEIAQGRVASAGGVEAPEPRFTNNGTAVANLRVAVTQRIQQDGGSAPDLGDEVGLIDHPCGPGGWRR